MERILEDLSPEERLLASERNLLGLFETLGAWPRVTVKRDATGLRTRCDVPFPLLNSVVQTRLPEDDLDGEVAAILAGYRRRELPSLWWVGPSSRPAKLGAALERGGARRVADPPVLTLDLERLNAPGARIAGFRIERVWNPETARDWGRVVAHGFGFPRRAAAVYVEGMNFFGYGPEAPFEHYVGYLDGSPVASASLFCHAGVAGLYNIATRPRARGRGIGSAVAVAPLLDALAEGFRWATIQASPGGVGVYRRLGFVLDGGLAQYLHPAGGAAPPAAPDRS